MTLYCFGEDSAFHHIGIAVGSLNGVIDPECPRWDDELQGVRVAFLDFSGAPIELIEPLGDTAPVSSALRSGRPLVHLCFEVSSLATSIRSAERHGFHVIGGPTPAVAFGGRLIAWVYGRPWGLVELLERAENTAESALLEAATTGED